MTLRIEILPRAEADLSEIGRDTDARWGRAQTRKYFSQLDRTLESIAQQPLVGSDMSHIAPGLRKKRSGSHNIYYRLSGAAVQVVRVLHERMHVTGRIDPPPQ